MTDDLIERVARAICGMPSCGAPKCPCGFAYDQMDAAQAALAAITAAGWTPPKPPGEETAAERGKRLLEQNIGFEITPGLEETLNRLLRFGQPETD